MANERFLCGRGRHNLPGHAGGPTGIRRIATATRLTKARGEEIENPKLKHAIRIGFPRTLRWWIPVPGGARDRLTHRVTSESSRLYLINPSIKAIAGFQLASWEAVNSPPVDLRKNMDTLKQKARACCKEVRLGVWMTNNIWAYRVSLQQREYTKIKCPVEPGFGEFEMEIFLLY